MWGGDRASIPKVHDSEEKSSITSKVDVFSLSSLEWINKATTGILPAGVGGYGIAVTGKDLIVFGGRCDAMGKCCHNELYALNTDTYEWRNIPCIETIPMEKCSCGFISYSHRGSEYLLTFGGRARKQPQNEQQGSLYPQSYGDYYTDEILTMDITRSLGCYFMIEHMVILLCLSFVIICRQMDSTSH